MNFREKLATASIENNSLLCVGLDPDPSMIADEFVVALNQRIIEATIDLVCAYKPNLAIYESMGKGGLLALEQTLDIIRKANPNIPIIGDGKRGDIGLCSLAYTHTLFDVYNFDAVTVNPYMGLDAVEPFLARRDKGVFILCRTSNPTGKDLQELMVVQGKSSTARPLYEIVAELALSWNKENGNVGLVVGATYPEQIYRVRQICPNLPFLIPGVGWQGGNVEKAINCAIDSEGKGFIINVSRQIMYAAKTPRGLLSVHGEAVKKMRYVARQFRDEINKNLPKHSAKSVVAISGAK
jgi:orotidine-5'-phosphate decarboxylase